MACRVGHFLHLIMLVRSWSIAPCCYMRYCTRLHVAWFMFFASQFFQSCEILWTCCRSSPGLIHALAFRSGTTWREYEEQTRHIKRLQTSLGIRCIRHPSHPTLRSVQRASSGSGYSGTSRRCGLARLRCMASAWPSSFHRSFCHSQGKASKNVADSGYIFEGAKTMKTTHIGVAGILLGRRKT